MDSSWVIIYESRSVNNIEIVKAVLEDNSIIAVVLNKMDSMHIHLSNAQIELYVAAEDVIQAKHIITKENL